MTKKIFLVPISLATILAIFISYFPIQTLAATPAGITITDIVKFTTSKPTTDEVGIYTGSSKSPTNAYTQTSNSPKINNNTATFIMHFNDQGGVPIPNGTYNFITTYGGKGTVIVANGSGSATVNSTDTPPASTTQKTPNPPPAAPTIQCNVSFNPLTWLLCPAVDGMMAIVNQLQDALNQELSVGAPTGSTDPNQIFCDSKSTSTKTCDAYQSAWATFRDIALGLLLIIGLFIIISQALGLEFLDAYTVRKAMPRLVAAAILIAISWPLLQFFVTLTNALGYGVQQLIYAPFSSFSHTTLSGGGEAAMNIIGAGAIASMGIFALLSFAATGALAVFIGYLIIVIRQILIILLVILAPIGILCMILPSTQKVFKLWFDELRLALLMFPIITGLIAVGRVFAAISLNTPNPTILDQFIGFAAFFAPYFLLPFTFKFAGGALSSISGRVHQAHQGAFNGLSKFRSQKRAETMQKARNYQRLSDRNKLTRGLSTAMGAALNPRDTIRGKRGIRAGRYTGALSQGGINLKDNQTWNDHQHDDSMLIALANRDLAQKKYDKALSNYNTAQQASLNTSITPEEKAQHEKDMVKYSAEMDARQNGMALADRIPSRNSSGTRLQALNALTRTGYQFSDDDEGYKEMHETVESIVGRNNTGAIASAMNTAQFNEKEAGNFHLAGINNGAYYDKESGLNKADPYALATRAKPAAIKAKGQLMRDSLQQARVAERAGDMAKANELYRKAEMHRLELRNVVDGTGANKNVALEEMDSVDKNSSVIASQTNGLDLERWRNQNSGKVSTIREDYVPGRAYPPGTGFTPAQQAQGYRLVTKPLTNGEIARQSASGNRRPSPEEM